MVLCFLVLVCSCLISSYFVLRKNHREIAHLVGIFGIISLVIVLILAPWQILFLLLISVFVSISCEYYTNKLNSTEIEYPPQPLRKSEKITSPIGAFAPEGKSTTVYWSNGNILDMAGNFIPSKYPSKFKPDYNLIYRGVYYCVHSNNKLDGLTKSQRTYHLNYRGNTYFICIDSPAQAPRLTPPSVTHRLRFRGSPYSVDKTTSITNLRSSEFDAVTKTSLPIVH